jgi:hypothetical protein
MKTKRTVALLMLAALALMPIVTAGVNPTPWNWIPGTVHYTYEGNSNRTVSMTTWPTDTVVTNKTILYAGLQYCDMKFGTPAANKVNITVPEATYYSAPFFLKTIGPNYLWCQVYLVQNGNGTLALAAGALTNVNVNITVTNSTGPTFTVSMARWGGPAPAGSCLLNMPLNMSVWLGTSTTDSTRVAFLFNMNFPMVETTGFIKVTIIQTAPWTPPYPSESKLPENSMNGYSKNSTGVRFNNMTGAAVLAGAGAGLNIYGYIPTVGAAYTSYIFTDHGVMAQVPVGGIWVPVDKLALLAPYIGLVSAIVLAVVAAGVFFRYRKKP